MARHDVVRTHAEAGIELRGMDELSPLSDRVIASTLEFSFVSYEPREIALVEPLTYPERAVAHSTEKPLQTAGVNERVRVGRRARTSDKSEQRQEIALAVERTFEEVTHGNP